jgi:hypothetical protein
MYAPHRNTIAIKQEMYAPHSNTLAIKHDRYAPHRNTIAENRKCMLHTAIK